LAWRDWHRVLCLTHTSQLHRSGLDGPGTGNRHGANGVPRPARRPLSRPSIRAVPVEGTDIVAAYVQRVNADGSQTVENIYRSTRGGIVAAPIDLSPSSSQVYLVLYGPACAVTAPHRIASRHSRGVSLPAQYTRARSRSMRGWTRSMCCYRKAWRGRATW